MLVDKECVEEAFKYQNQHHLSITVYSFFGYVLGDQLFNLLLLETTLKYSKV